MQDYKHIHIGHHIKSVAELKELSVARACKFLKCSAADIKDMYSKPSLDSQLLLMWCKLLDYNFFMFYHTHLQLYEPSASSAKFGSKPKLKNKEEAEEYTFRKNLYSPEIIEWLMNQFENNTLSAQDIIQKYKIPKTTFYRWRKKRNSI